MTTDGVGATADSSPAATGRPEVTTGRSGVPLFGVEHQPSDVPAYEAICRNCDWKQSLPERDMAEHAKRVHEEWYDHNVILDLAD